jgi:hypothetical protein
MRSADQSSHTHLLLTSDEGNGTGSVHTALIQELIVVSVGRDLASRNQRMQRSAVLSTARHDTTQYSAQLWKEYLHVALGVEGSERSRVLPYEVDDSAGQDRYTTERPSEGHAMLEVDDRRCRALLGSALMSRCASRIASNTRSDST